MNCTVMDKHHRGRKTHFLGRFWLLLTRKRPYEEIESSIKPLVDSINAAQSLRTIASCQGHWYGKPPYIYFKGLACIAASIERQLREDAMNEHSKLVSNWCVNGLFDGNYEQAFLLHAPDYNRGSRSLIKSIWLFGLCRRRLNTEIMTLTYLVKQAVLSDIRENDKPKIRNSARYF